MSGAAFGLPLHSFHFQKNKKLYVFESDILHILLADSIISTAKRFREMKKLQFLKAGDYMKTITRAKYLDRIIEPVSYTHLDVYKRQVRQSLRPGKILISWRPMQRVLSVHR